MSKYSRSALHNVKAAALVLCALMIISSCGIGMDNQARLERGQQAYASGEYRAAIIDAKNILQNEPANVGARLLLGRSSVRIGDALAAEKELRRAMDLGAEKSEVVVDLGRTLLLLGEFDKIEMEITTDAAADEAARLAILKIRGNALMAQEKTEAARALFSEILAADNADLETMLAVVRSYVIDKALIQARATLDQVISIDASYVPAWLTSGWLSSLQQNMVRSESDFTRAREIAVEQSDVPGQVKALVGIVEAQLALNQLDAAKGTLASLTEVAPNNLPTRFLTARVSFLEEDWVAASEQLQNILRENARFVPARILLGAVHLNRGNLSQAEIYLAEAVAAMPSNKNARKLLAEARLQQGRGEEATEALQPMIDGDAADPGALAMAARASIGLGEFNQAIQYLRRRVDSNPRDSNLVMDLAAAHLSIGEIDEAQEILLGLPALAEEGSYRREFLLVLAKIRSDDYTQALAAAREMQDSWPDDARLHNMLGGILITTGDVAEARKSFEIAQKVDPSNIVSLISLARLDAADKDFEAARKRFAKALELQPNNVGLMVSLGQVAAYENDGEVAIRWLEKARNADANSVVARAILGKVFVANKEYAAAEQVIQEAIRISDEVADLHNTFGLAISGNGDHPGAAASFATAVELNPEEPLYSLNLGREYVILEDDERAQEVLQASLQSNPDHFATAAMLASSFARSGDMEQAMQIAQTLIQRNPDVVGPKVLLAELLYRDKQNHKAARLYDEAIALSGNRNITVRAYRLRAASGVAQPEAPLLKYLSARPADADMRVVLAQDYQGRGDMEAAGTEYEKVVATAPDNFIALNNLAWIYFTRNDAKAEVLARRANEIAPDNASVVDTLGWILVNTGSVADGLEYLRKSVELSGGEAEIRYHLAAGLAKSGSAGEARKLLEDVLLPEEDFPSRGDAEVLLGTLATKEGTR